MLPLFMKTTKVYVLWQLLQYSNIYHSYRKKKIFTCAFKPPKNKKQKIVNLLYKKITNKLCHLKKINYTTKNTLRQWFGEE